MILWDVETGAIIRRFQGHSDAVTAVAFSPDGQAVVSGSLDDTIIVWDATTGDPLRRFPGHQGNVWDVAFNPDGTQIVSSSAVIWRYDTLQQLQAWTVENRFLPDIRCNQSPAYGVPNTCIDGIVQVEATLAPTQTPFPVRPAPALDVLVELTDTAARYALRNPTSTPIPAPTLAATRLPTTTPVAGQIARFGENRGDIVMGGAQSWQYEAQAGEILVVSVMADRPANDADPATRREQNLLDTRVLLYDPTGQLIAENDDIRPGIETNSQIMEVLLRESGWYTIVVRSWKDNSGGAYTLFVTDFDSQVATEAASTRTPQP
jgi:WD40 repeat protein